MNATGFRLHLAVLAGYLCVAAAFAWPLPLHMGTTLFGTVAGDTGVYVWNLWVFRHEIVAHGHFPFLTLEVLPLTPPLPLTLHNYTTAANIAAFFLIPMMGAVAAFNLLMILSPALAAYTMFLLARRVTGDAGAGWLAGLAFGFCPFISARTMEHFSLVQAAPLPLFVLLFKRLRLQPTFPLAAATGATVAWAFLSDPYYAVYCVLIAAVMLVAAALDVRFVRVTPFRLRWTLALDLALVCLVGLIAGVIIRGGGRMEVLGVRVSMTRLYTPVLVATFLTLVRLALWLRPRFSWAPALPPLRAVLALGFTCAVLVSPVLAAMTGEIGERNGWLSPPVPWRSSAPGLDLLSFFLPNPLHPLVNGAFDAWLRASPGGLVENVASVPWTLFVIIALGIAVAGTRLPRRWLVWTVFFALLALGPFIKIGGVLTYVPTPWTFLRYVPVLGAARMPPRFAILVILGVAMLAAFALRDLRARAKRPWAVTAAATLLLLFETLPAPRTLHSAAVPSVYRTIAADPRDVRVLNLPFGLRDGLSSYGNTTAAWQFYQIVHEKQIMGGYVSRLPARDLAAYQARRVMRTLMDLSAGREVSPQRLDAAVARAHENRAEHNIGYVVMDTSRCSAPLMDFAKRAFDLQFVGADGVFELYRTWSGTPAAAITASRDPR